MAEAFDGPFRVTMAYMLPLPTPMRRDLALLAGTGPLSYAWKTVVCALAYTTASALGAPLAAVLGAALPAMPPGTDPARLMRAAFIASLTLGASLGPLASGLRTG
jgi:hypothetical protein